VAVFAVVAALIQLPGLASVARTRDSQADFDRGNNTAALSEATSAINAEPWAASPYVQRALVLESLGRLDAARVDLLRAEKREPDNYAHPLVLSRIDAERGDARAAVADLRKARALRPASPFVAPPSK
jgi:tetratricopeptide (TPR) repeat protein